MADDLQDGPFGRVIRVFPADFEALREFKRSDGLVGYFPVVLIGCLHLKANSDLPLVEFRPFGGVFLRPHFTVHPKVEEGLELALDLDPLPFELRAVGSV